MNFIFYAKNRFPAALRHTLTVLILMVVFITLQLPGQAQIVNQSTKKKISIGIGEFNDFWINMPSDVKSRLINQGFTIMSTYNVPFGKSNFSFAIGLGLTIHNMYGNFYVNSRTDTTDFKKIPDIISYKKSKMTLTYLEIPVEFRFKSKSK